MDMEKALGWRTEKSGSAVQNEKLIQYINLKLAAMGYPVYGSKTDSEFLEIAQPLLSNYQEKSRILSSFLCPADRRIQDFLDDYLKDVAPEKPIRLPVNTFILDRHGLARTMSLPPNKDSFESDIVSSYRVKQGVLHNPKSDRRTTQGVFHIAEGGFAIPDDKTAVPKLVFANLLAEALRPPQDLLRLPFTSAQNEQAELFISLLLRPLVCPAVHGRIPEKTMEIRFFAPGNLVSNLDFVESIFGNAGDPYLPENDAALDAWHWTGHTGCVILAPHMIHLKKKDLGLPHYDQATERQRRDRMCWKKENEPYNDGDAFKITCRDERGIMVTLIADNYFGYCKKEVKTQISFSSNLYGLSEEEHAGGAIAFPSYDLGEEFSLDPAISSNALKFADVVRLYGSFMDVKPEGYAVDKKYPQIIYVPEGAVFNLQQQSVTWTVDGREQKIRLIASNLYMLPSGYKIHIKKLTGGHNWILIGTVAEGTTCHKPCTVSGGGKSEISKSIVDAMIQGPMFTADFHKDFELVAEIIERDFGSRFKEKYMKKRPSRPILSSKRSLGSVIKLFTPSAEFTDEYNDWLKSLPPHIKDVIFIVKRHYRRHWGKNWREHFSVDVVNGHLGHELKYAGRELVSNYLRVGREKDGSWRIYRVRQDFSPAQKVQTEDDISTSVVVPGEHVSPDLAASAKSVKLVANCEYRLFQRPDDAIHRGYDKQAELDLATPGTFLSNYEPLTASDAKELLLDAMGFDLYTPPMKNLIQDFVEKGSPTYFVASSHPRVVDGKPSKNPRYLQNRPDLVNPVQRYFAEMGVRLWRKIPEGQPVQFTVNAVLPGRRNNPRDAKNKIPALAVYNPIHYQELPELFMDFVCSVTGKSPSTTGFGSEGALTKGPFNALCATADLNNALVSYILTGYAAFSSAAGYVGPNFQVDHDVTLLIPEVWSRMAVHERDPEFLIKNRYLEKLEDFEHEGRVVKASILGYRITLKFIHAFLGRIFSNPNAVFHEEMLKPEQQDMSMFAEGIDNLVATQKRVAQHYFNDGSIESACPPLAALLHIMAHGHYNGKDLNHPEVRGMFTHDYLIASPWYQERLAMKQHREVALWQRHIAYLENFVSKDSHYEAIQELRLKERLEEAQRHLEIVKSPAYLKILHGTIGADPLRGQFHASRPNVSLAKERV
ncbi:MAG TPA: hypothetical protein VL688_05725 [Verrucomicrobiae bacterium]|jgi:hypothetical protein|nr:hypothetical protein [Verrucomicrobiae bacterium]